MEDQSSFNELDSLKIIQQMINTAKKEQKDDGKGWIIWGWMLFGASVTTIINVEFQWFQIFFFWNIFGVFTIMMGLFEVVKSQFSGKTKRVRAYTKDIFEKLNIGFFISIMLIIVSINMGVSPGKGFPILMDLYGFWILIYATVLNFKPSMIGAYTMWALAFIALFVSSFQYVMVLHALGVLCGYIIPGYIAKKRFNDQSIGKD